MRWLIVIIGGLATVGFVAVSGWVNFRFGLSLGRDAMDGHVLGVASACADGMKAILPFVIVGAWRNIRPVMLIASMGLWVLCSAYSLTSSLGFAASNRAEVTDGKRLDATRFAQLKQALSSKQSRLATLGQQRDAGAIDSELAGLRQHRRWLSTAECTSATVSLSRRFCKQYFELQAERGRAMKAQRLEVDVDRLREELRQWTGFAGKAIDPQISVINQIIGLGEDRVTLAVTILLSLMLEVGSGLGFFLVLDKSKRAQVSVVAEGRKETVDLLPAQAANRSDVEWLRERLRSDGMASLALWEAHEDYLRWGETHRCRDTRTLSEFAEWLQSDMGLDINEVRGQRHVLGVCLADAAKLRLVAAGDAD